MYLGKPRVFNARARAPAEVDRVLFYNSFIFYVRDGDGDGWLKKRGGGDARGRGTRGRDGQTDGQRET